MDARDLEGCSRSELIARAESIGVDNAKVLTRTELIDEILRRAVSDPIERRIARGLLGVARDLVARVVERGLHLPDAAAVIRGSRTKPSASEERPPIATVTLAEIYANQGHRGRALVVLDEVLSQEPDHAAARSLRDRVAASASEDVSAEPGPEAADPAPEAEAEASFTPLEPEDSSARVASMQPLVVEGPVGMLDDAPLPTHYDVDEVVLMPVDPATVFVYWEVREATRAEAAASAPGGRLVLRILAVTPSPTGPQLTMRDVDLRELVGDWLVRDMPVGAVLRAAVGWRRETAFEPISVAMELTAPPDRPSTNAAHRLARFAADGTLDEPVEEGPLAQAVARARRAAQHGGPAGESLSWPLLGSS